MAFQWHKVVARFVGAHITDEEYTCVACDLNWLGYHCNVCNCTVWSRQKHFDKCGQSCGCCRAINDEDWPSGCDACRFVAVEVSQQLLAQTLSHLRATAEVY